VLIKIAKNFITIGHRVKIKYIDDRPGHDQRYALNSNKIKKKLKWKPKIKFDNGLKETFLWYLNNKKYYSSLTKKDIVKRLGLKK
jgi:dTDP-glucose 4,6-dehydratase